MKKSEVVQHLLHRLGEKAWMPQHEKGLAFAPTNIALCKYWGKRDPELNLPVTSSLSAALADKGALTNLAWHDGPHDRVILNDDELAYESGFVQRLVQFLNLFRPTTPWHLTVDIKMNIPVAAGLASSACGFASLIQAMNDMFQWQMHKRDLSILARLGSGSAARSLWGGFVEWHAGLQPDGMDSFGEPLAFEWPELMLGILTISTAEKPVSSREAMQRTVNTSALYASWPKKVGQDLSLIKQALQVKNFPLLGGTSESNALSMHATMLGSWPPICYFRPETITAMQKVWQLRQDGLAVYFTEDAGSNLKLLFLEKDRASIEAEFPGLDVISMRE